MLYRIPPATLCYPHSFLLLDVFHSNSLPKIYDEDQHFIFGKSYTLTWSWTPDTYVFRLDGLFGLIYDLKIRVDKINNIFR